MINPNINHLDHELWPLGVRIGVILGLTILVWGLVLGVALAVLRTIPACWL
jgi:hypothetical protein